MDLSCTFSLLMSQARTAVHAASTTKDFSRQFYVGEDEHIR